MGCLMFDHEGPRHQGAPRFLVIARHAAGVYCR